MLQRSLGQAMLFTRFLIERDALSASMTRMGSGFTPDSVVHEAKAHLQTIQNLVEEIDRIRHYPKTEIIPIKHLPHIIEEGCCPKK